MNHQLSVDPDTMNELFVTRFVCSDQLADDPYLTAAIHRDVFGDFFYSISSLSLINSVLNALGHPIICAIFDENDRLIKFDIATIDSDGKDNKSNSI